MSRVSRKSELSPSVTKAPNAIDLGKNSGVDMGGKTTPSVTSGGIGVTREITNIGGLSVTGGVNVDISPLDLGISYDSSENSLGIAGGAEIPGGILGASGGVTIDLNTGQVTGGSVGAEALGIGINISNSKEGGIGVGITLQIPFTPIEFEIGFGFSPKKSKPSPTPTPAPSPTPAPASDSQNCGAFKWQLCRFAIMEESFTGLGTYRFNDGCSATETYAKKYESGWLKLSAILLDGMFGVDQYTIKSVTESKLLTYKTSNFIADYGNTILPVPSSNYEYFNPNKFAIVTIQQVLTKYRCILLKDPNQTVTISDFEYSLPNHTGCYDYGGHGTTLLKKQIILVSVIFPPCPPNSPTPTPTPTPSPPQPFPNPPPKKNNKMDTCCRENLKFLRAIYTGLGIGKFPGQLPSTIIQEIPKEGEAPAEPSQVPIKDFVDLLTWQFERDDERWGQWQIQIDIKDSDITKEGDQKKSIKFPNLAESIAEVEGQLLSIMTNVDALVALQVKNLAESGMARQEAIKGYLAAKAIIKYMAFKSTETDVPVPMTFTAGAETISKLLEESEGHIKGTDYVEKETFRDVCLELLQAAAIIRAVHWQKIDSKSDTKSQLLNLLKGSVNLAASIAKPQNPNREGSEEKTFNPEENFEDFIDSVEDGFRDKTGITDIQNPYGKPPSRRPQIRQIGDNVSQAGENN